MKSELIIGLLTVAFLLSVGTFYVGRYGSIFSDRSIIPSGGLNDITNTTPTVPDSGQNVFLSPEVIALHNNPSDCWIIVGQGVYAVSAYLSVHPGGASEITPYCGKDATQAFQTRGGTGQHSGGAQSDLSSFFVGNIGTQVSEQKIINIQEAPPPINTGQRSDEREYEDDDD